MYIFRYHPRWCPVDLNSSYLKSYTWDKFPDNFRKNDFILDESPPERSRDGKDYINLDKITILNFEICEKGKLFLGLN